MNDGVVELSHLSYLLLNHNRPECGRRRKTDRRELPRIPPAHMVSGTGMWRRSLSAGLGLVITSQQWPEKDLTSVEFLPDVDHVRKMQRLLDARLNASIPPPTRACMTFSTAHCTQTEFLFRRPPTERLVARGSAFDFSKPEAFRVRLAA